MQPLCQKQLNAFIRFDTVQAGGGRTPAPCICVARKTIQNTDAAIKQIVAFKDPLSLLRVCVCFSEGWPVAASNSLLDSAMHNRAPLGIIDGVGATVMTLRAVDEDTG